MLSIIMCKNSNRLNCTSKVRQKKLIFEGVFYDENILSTVQSIITIPIFHVNTKGLWYNDSDIQGGMP